MPHHEPVQKPPTSGVDLTTPGRADVRDQTDLLRIVVYFAAPCFVMLSFLWYFFLEKEKIAPGVFPILILLNIPLTVAGILLINRFVGSASTGLVKTIYAVGDIAPPRSYPRQDTLIIRGQYAEAAEYFRDHLIVDPEDNAARLRLAELLERFLHDAAGAERLYLEVRRRVPPPTAREAMAAANGLIDLYRRTGERGRLKVELARFAQDYGGTSAGADAARALREMKAENATR